MSSKIVIKAIESGIALPNNPVYEEMLEDYPHYQVKREKRDKQMKSISNFVNKYEQGGNKDGDGGLPNQFKY